MPSKRQAPIESDVEENSGASLVSKRARTAEDSDEELTSTQPTSPRSTKARGKVRQTDNDLQLGGEESEDDIGPMVPNEDEERRFEEENEQSIRERIANRGKVQGVRFSFS